MVILSLIIFYPSYNDIHNLSVEPVSSIIALRWPTVDLLVDLFELLGFLLCDVQAD